MTVTVMCIHGDYDGDGDIDGDNNNDYDCDIDGDNKSDYDCDIGGDTMMCNNDVKDDYYLLVKLRSKMQIYLCNLPQGVLLYNI